MVVTTADGHKERFIKLLHELFQLDKPELDFGLYRIMHAKSDQLSRFIREDLAQAIEDAFAEQGEQQLSAMRHDIDEKRKQAEELGAPDPDSVPAVKQARAAYHVAKQEQSASVDIYDHLYRFFSRYYDKGDFMSRRHHVAENDSRAAPYAVPYDGREVYLHWANKDQYYVKSSETLANFTFNLNEALKTLQGSAAQTGLVFDSTDAALKVHCRVVDASEGEHNDVKESTERFFIIHHDEPIRLDGADLVLQFEYRPDPEKTGKSSAWQKKRLMEAEERIMEALRATDGVVAYRENLATRAPTDKQKERTLLGKYLQQYTARNTMDYFIHKDLDGFLSRELDFYIKNEILRLDDISGADILIVEQQLKKIQVLRKLAKKIITFLAQLENFQKKLWLKKKFVIDVDYCATLDYFSDDLELLSSIVKNKKQRRRWVEDFALNIEDLDADIKDFSTYEVLEKEKYSCLLVDTSNFDESTKSEIIKNVLERRKLISVLINSDNFHALRLALPLFNASVANIFIDPPYNTGDDGFIYKDNYQTSSWLSMVSDRIRISYPFLRQDGVLYSCVGDEEQEYLSSLLRQQFGKDNFFANLVWEKKKKGSFLNGKVVRMKDYIACVAKDIECFGGLVGEIAREIETYPVIKTTNSRGMRTIKPGIKSKFRESNKVVKKGTRISAGNMELILHSDMIIKNNKLDKEVVIESNWINGQQSLDEYAEDGTLYITQDLYLRRVVDTPRYKRMRDILPRVGDAGEHDFRSYDIENLNKYGWGSNEDANDELHQMLGEQNIVSYPKPSKLVTLLSAASRHKKGVWLDYFAGSGTTAHAVINLNRDDGGDRSYLLIESGSYFDNVLKKRVSKASYAKQWQDGRPIADQEGKLFGISHAFKYLRLESYDDTLNNLELDQDSKRDALMEQHPELRHDYTLKYLLDVETRGSASLLNTEWFRDPEGYMLKVKQPGSDESRKTAVDLVETFNWLIGLHVSHLDKPRSYVARFERDTDPELPEDQNTRLKAVSLRENEDGAYWIRQVEGHVRRIPGSDEDLAKVLVVWRKLTDDAEKDAAVLEALLEKYKIGTTDSEFDTIYINGPHGLSLTGRARDRVHSLEETFHARMWEGCDDDL